MMKVVRAEYPVEKDATEATKRRHVNFCIEAIEDVLKKQRNTVSDHVKKQLIGKRHSFFGLLVLSFPNLTVSAIIAAALAFLFYFIY
jgi:hypothetical protein